MKPAVALTLSLIGLLPGVAWAQPFEASFTAAGSRLQSLPDALSPREQAWGAGLASGARVTRVSLPRQRLSGGLGSLVAGAPRSAEVEARGVSVSLPGGRALRLRFASAEAVLTWAALEGRLLQADGAARIVEVRGAQAIVLEGSAFSDAEQAFAARRAAWEALPVTEPTALLAVTRGGAVRVRGGPSGPFAAAARRTLAGLRRSDPRLAVQEAGAGAWITPRDPAPSSRWVAFLQGGPIAELSLQRSRAAAAIAATVAVDALYEALVGPGLVGGPLADRVESPGVIGHLEGSLAGRRPTSEVAPLPEQGPVRPDVDAARARAERIEAARAAFLAGVRPPARPALTPADLVLQAAAEALRQRLLGVRTGAAAAPALVGEDRAYAEGTLATIEATFAALEVPWPLVEDLTVTAAAIANAPAGGMDEAVQDALARLASARVAGVAAFDAPLGEPAGAAPRQPARPRLEVGPLPAPGAGTVSLPGPQQVLLGVLRDAPHGAEPGVGQVIEAYADAMNAVEGFLPPFLPFALTLRRPIAVGQPGARFSTRAPTSAATCASTSPAPTSRPTATASGR